jgi:toxin-antitoxin system PIN domain toxin
VTVLVDVNVLIALIDPSHAHHTAAHAWAAKVTPAGWATCPIVENGVIPIVGHPSYPRQSGAGSPPEVARLLHDLRGAPGHAFWPDDISLLDAEFIDLDAILHSRHITDSYLLALAVKHGGRFATFDRRLRTDAVKGGREALIVVPTP